MNKQRSGIVLAAIGLIMLIMLFMMNVFYHATVSVWAVAIGCIIGFVGFYLISPSDAEGGGGFLVNSATRIIGVIRTGQRSSDLAVVVDNKNGGTDIVSTAPTVPVIPMIPNTTMTNDPTGVAGETPVPSDPKI